MKIAPRTVLTTKTLLADETAADLMIWNIETLIYGQVATFYLYRRRKHFELFMVQPLSVWIGSGGTLEEIVALYNKCISTSSDTHGRVIGKAHSHANF